MRKLIKTYNPRGLVEVEPETKTKAEAEAKHYERYVFDRLEEAFRSASEAIYSSHKGKRIR